MSSGVRLSLVRQPLSFVENRGRVDGRVAYYAVAGATSLFFTRDGLTLDLSRGGGTKRSWALEQVFVGGRRAVSPQATRPAPGVFNSFVGPRRRWHIGMRSYGSVAYREVWPGIDVVYSGLRSGLEYRFVIRPGADPRAIRLAYRGASALRVASAGGLHISTPVGVFSEHRPIAYQYVGGRRVPVRARLELLGPGPGRGATGGYAFRLGAYDANRPVVVDPVVFGYVGFLGGSGDDHAFDVAVDRAGGAYVAGSTDSPDFPATPGPFSAPRGNTEAFVAKLDPTGTLVYADYIGGAGRQDTARGVAVDRSGDTYITGPTDSTQSGFPVTVGPDLTFNGGEDAFVAKLDPTGTQLLYAGYIGGDKGEGGRDIAVDANGNAYVAGTTKTADSTFPAKVGPQLHYGGGNHDGFVAKVNPSGSGPVYCSYIGGTGDEDNVRGVAPDAAGNLYITGHVGGPPGSDSSEGFPVRSART